MIENCPVDACEKRELISRIEALEAALREILDPPSTLDEPERDIDLILQMRAIARAALAPEQDK